MVYLIVAFFILNHYRGVIRSTDELISWLSVLAVWYAYGQWLLAWKSYIDGEENTQLLREIRDLLKQR